MAFASVGDRGGASAKAAGTTLSMNPSASCAAGNVLVVWYAYDAHGPAGGSTSGNSTPRVMCADSQGNIYTQVGGHEDSDTTRPAIAIFVSQLATGLGVGDTITVTLTNAVVVAKGMTAWEFSLTGRWAFNEDGWARVTSLGVDPGSVTVGGLDSQEYLFLHVLGAKGPSTDAYTWDGSWTRVGTQGSTGGVDASNCTVTGGFQIATNTGATVDVQSDTADRRYLQQVCAICQVTEPAFPTTPILDAFNRADENPLANGTWDTVTKANGSAFGRLTSNQEGGAAGGSYWSTAMVGDCEVYGTMAVAGSSGSDGPLLIIEGTGDSSTSTRSGYGVNWWKTPLAGTDNLAMGTLGNNAAVAGGVITRTALPTTANDRVGLSHVGFVMHLFIDHGGGGWKWVAAIYWQSTRLTARSLGIGQADGTSRWDDFGGGDYVAPVTFHLLPILHVGA